MNNNLNQMTNEVEQQILQRLQIIECNTLLAAKEMLTLEDVAKLTGFSMSHIYHLTSTKEIPHYKPNGRVIYVSKSDLQAWMSRGKVESNEQIERIATQKTIGL